MDRGIVFSKIAELKSKLLKPNDKVLLMAAIDKTMVNGMEGFTYKANDVDYRRLNFGPDLNIIYTISESHFLVTDIETSKYYFDNSESEQIINEYLQTNSDLVEEVYKDTNVNENDFPLIRKLLPNERKNEILGDLSEAKEHMAKQGKSNLLWKVVLAFTLILIVWGLFFSSEKSKDTSK